jgi:hypothetical protein
MKNPDEMKGGCPEDFITKNEGSQQGLGSLSGRMHGEPVPLMGGGGLGPKEQRCTDMGRKVCR